MAGHVAATSDIVVVGAGIVGCAVAYELARRGASVQIVDDRPAGMGATQASAGVLAPYIEAHEGHPLLDLTVRSLDLYDAFIAQLGSDVASTLRYRRSGTLEIALDADGLHRLEAAAASLRRKGVHARLLDAAGARSEEPHVSEAVVGGLLIPSHGYVSAAHLTRALTAAARRHGAQLIEHGRVRRIVNDAGDIRVETDRGSLAGNGDVL